MREIRDNRDRIRDFTGHEAVHFCYPSGDYAPEFLPWLRELGVNDTPEGWLGYQYYLGWRTADPAGQEREKKELTRGWAIGSPSWKRDTALKYRHLLGRHRLKAGELVELKELEWAAALNGMLEKLGKTKQDALREAKGSAWKIALARQLRLSTTATNGWIARQLHMGSASSVSVYLCQMKKRTTWEPCRPEASPT